LAGYAQRIAIGNARIRQIDLDARTVTFTYRDNHSPQHAWGGFEQLTLDALEFIDRFVMHVMPRGMARMRQYGWWAGRNKQRELRRVRVALGRTLLPEEVAEPESGTDVPPDDVPAGDVPEDEEREDEEPPPREPLFMPCAQCGQRTMRMLHRDWPPSLARLAEWPWTIWPERQAPAAPAKQRSTRIADWMDASAIHLRAAAYLQPREFP